jgi:hypothetical protein
MVICIKKNQQIADTDNAVQLLHQQGTDAYIVYLTLEIAIVGNINNQHKKITF